MRNKLTKIAMAATLAVLLPLMSCDNSHPSELVGHWQHESGSMDKKPKDMELLKDGTGVCDGGSISWKVENKRFIIQSSSFGMISDYKMSGFRLTFIDSDGDSTTYVEKTKRDREWKSALVGGWIGVSGEENGVVMELLSDGTGVLTEDSKGIAITWKTENGRFYVTAFERTWTWAESYKLQGSLLTFTKDNGKVSEYTKCNKDCQETAEAAVRKSKKGSISGTIMDPFTGKAVELPTVWINGTTFTSQKIPGGLPDGKFKFERIAISDSSYTLQAGKPKYSQGQVKFSITKDNFEVVQNIYIYRLDVAPGLYRPLEGKEAEEIKAHAVYQAVCKESIFAFRLKFITENPSTKKKEENVLPPPTNVPMEISLLSKIATSVTSPIEVTSYPVLSESAKNHEDCGVDAKETLLLPNLSKGTSISSDYKSENLYGIKGTLPKGKQFLVVRQNGKLVNAYYVNAQ